ncbi:MAG TPA: ATP:cob(I)alamin adenosyltransferase [Thermoanaerobaculia bacterium]|nr:ATP:cob(I)alamin adenosyltransferase [Thermoanaerobaculia bacterium]
MSSETASAPSRARLTRCCTRCSSTCSKSARISPPPARAAFRASSRTGSPSWKTPSTPWSRSSNPLRNFILPAGSAPAAQLHVACTVCRRAERLVVALQHDSSATLSTSPTSTGCPTFVRGGQVRQPPGGGG